MKKILYIATIGLTLLTSSCNDFLDRQVPQGIVGWITPYFSAQENGTYPQKNSSAPAFTNVSYSSILPKPATIFIC